MPSKGSFGAYLDYAQRDTSASPRAASGSSNLRFLKVLPDASETKLPMSVLLEFSGLDPILFRAALRELRDADYISISGPALDEVVQLTDGGAEVVKLTQH